MHELVDMHCHVLPNVDDGPSSMDSAVAVLIEAYRQGIRTMIATPHYHPGRYQVRGEQVMEKLAQLQAEIEREKIGIKLYPGQECYYFSGLMDALREKEALTLAGSEYVLVEFSPETQFSEIERAVREFEMSEYRMIIAHFERYECLFNRQERLEELKEHGALLQLNFDVLLVKDSLFRHFPWRAYLKNGIIDFLGSDSHSLRVRPLRVAQAVEWMEKHVNPEICKKVLEDNVRDIIGA